MISSNNSNITPGSESSNLSDTSSNTTPNRRFSFNKKPINNRSVSRHSSQISIINNYPSQQCDHISHDTDHTKFYSKYRGIMKDKDELPENKINDLSYEYNYDEKIRAPRMSTVSLSKVNSKDVFRNQMLDSNINNIKEEGNAEIEDENVNGTLSGNENQNLKSNSTYNYKPASFDLSKPVRKYSLCDNSYKDDSKNYITFERKKSVISNASSNNSSNISPTRTTTVRKESDLISDCPLDEPMNTSRKVSTLKHIKQINEPTRLMNYVPPVLRPIEKTTFLMQKELEKPNKNSIISTATTTTKNSNKTNETSSTSTSEILTNNSSSKTSTSSLSSVPSPVVLASSPDKNPLSLFNLAFKTNSTGNSNTTYNNNQNTHNNNNEPSHLHWKPNSSRNNCLSCNSQFSIIKRKHHCRHCGEIFCYNCLKNLANLNLLAKFEKPCRDLTISPTLSINTINSENNEGNENNGNKFNEDLNTVTSNSSHNLSYSKFSKVCPACYDSWLQFLNSNIDYEDSYKNLDDLLDKNPLLKNDRMKSITGVPTDWNWSSF